MKNKIWIAVLVVMASGISLIAATTPAFVSMQQHYEAIRLTLVQNKTAGISGHAHALADLARRHDKAIAGAADALAKSSDLKSARTAFDALSKAMIKFRAATGDASTMVVYCPMEKKSWIQPKSEIGNPYLGGSMAGCGQVVKESK